MSYLSESVGDVGTSDRDRLSHLVAAVFRRAVGLHVRVQHTFG